MNKFVHQANLFVRRNASTILTCVGAAGVVTTAVMAVKATPKALKVLELAEEEKGEDLTVLEKVQVAGPAYITSVLVGVSTIACIFGANALNKRQQAALMSAYALLDSSYKGYKDKVIELYGEEVDQKIKSEIAKDNFKEQAVTVSDETRLFYDEFSKRYFNATDITVQRAEYNLNRNMTQRGYAYLNEFYIDLGIEPIDGGWELGWSPGLTMEYAWQEWVDFNHYHGVIDDDGLEYCMISFYVEPKPNFMDYEE